MDRTSELLKTVTECILDEEGSFSVIVNADMLDLPLDGAQRLLLGGKATPYMDISDEGISVGLSINRVHYDTFIPWDAVNAVEGENKAFYCRRVRAEKKEEKGRHLRLVKRS
jgi:hypothetical protein